VSALFLVCVAQYVHFFLLSQSNDVGKMHSLVLTIVSGKVEALPVETVAEVMVFVKFLFIFHWIRGAAEK
jgi:hypothetical protein